MPDYLEGDLDLTRSALLDAHLDACSECSREFAEMRGTIALLRNLSDPEPPPFLVERVMARIRDGEGRRTVGDRLRDFFGSLASPQIALPATALGVGLLMATGVVDPAAISFERLLGNSGGSQMAVELPTVPHRVARVEATRTSSQAPAVAPAPRVRIGLPGQGTGRSSALSQLASNGAAPRQITRWSPRSVRNPIGDTSLTMNVANNMGRSAGTGERPLASGSAFRAEAGESAAAMDQRLDAMIRQPALFAADFSGRSIVEQEALLRGLAQRAAEQGRGEEVLAALRGVPDLRARQLASAMSAELQRLDVSSVASLVPEEAEAAR
jgi:hypothetical protein